VVSLKSPARRIASFSPSNTEILYAIGCGHKIVLRDSASDFPSTASSIPSTNAFQLSPEHIAGFSPDLLLLSHLDTGRIKPLLQLGFRVAVFDPTSLKQVFANIQKIGQLCGANAPARNLINQLRQRLHHIQKTIAQIQEPPRIFIEVDGSDPWRPWTAGSSSLISDLLRLAGMINIANALKQPYARINIETILSQQPDFILLMDVIGHSSSGILALKSRPGWATLNAIRRGNVIDHIHPDLLSRPGPRLLDGLEALIQAVYFRSNR